MKEGYWKIEYSIDPSDISLEHIANMIQQGFTSGQILEENDDDGEGVEE